MIQLHDSGGRREGGVQVVELLVLESRGVHVMQNARLRFFLTRVSLYP